MTALLRLLAESLQLSCSCVFKPGYITNGRWICDPDTPNMVTLQADVAGTGVVSSSNIAGQVGTLAGTTVSLGGDNVTVTGSQTCTTRDCSTQVPTTQNYFWVFGLIAGIIILLIVVTLAVVIFLWWRRQKLDKPIEE